MLFLYVCSTETDLSLFYCNGNDKSKLVSLHPTDSPTLSFPLLNLFRLKKKCVQLNSNELPVGTNYGA